jgi:hypothetical protein
MRLQSVSGRTIFIINKLTDNKDYKSSQPFDFLFTNQTNTRFENTISAV